MTNYLNKKFLFLYSLLFVVLAGGIFFGFQYSAETLNSCHYTTVSHVVDGDTFDVADGTRVRLIGIDAPEEVDPDQDVQFFATEAKEELQKLVEGKSVCLRKGDHDSVDKYGRQLRYVYVGNQFVNALMVEEGYAKAYTVYPFEFRDEFIQDEQIAKEKGVGLWDPDAKKQFDIKVAEEKALTESCSKDSIRAKDAKDFYDQVKTVCFFVAKGYDTGSTIFFDSADDEKASVNFTAVIFNASRSKFHPDAAVFYNQKAVEMTGKIEKYENTPEIVLINPSQIKLLDSN